MTEGQKQGFSERLNAQSKIVNIIRKRIKYELDLGQPRKEEQQREEVKIQEKQETHKDPPMSWQWKTVFVTSGVCLLGVFGYIARQIYDKAYVMDLVDGNGVQLDLDVDRLDQLNPFYQQMKKMMLKYTGSPIDSSKLQSIADEYNKGDHKQAQIDLFNMMNPSFKKGVSSTYGGLILNDQQSKLLQTIQQDKGNTNVYNKEYNYIVSHPYITQNDLQNAETRIWSDSIISEIKQIKVPKYVPIPSQTTVPTPVPDTTQKPVPDTNQKPVPGADQHHSIFENPYFDIIGGVGILAAIYFGIKYFNPEQSSQAPQDEPVIQIPDKPSIYERLMRHKTIVIVSIIILSVLLLIKLFF